MKLQEKLQEMAFPKFYISKIYPGPPNNAITIFEYAELFSPPPHMNLLPMALVVDKFKEVLVPPLTEILLLRTCSALVILSYAN